MLGRRPAGHWGGPGPLQMCCALLCFMRNTETIEVDMVNKGPMKVLRNEDITIPCKFSDYSSTVLDMKTVGIRWVRIIATVEHKVHEFDGGKMKHMSHRNGSTVLNSEIQAGNAALHLPRVQFNEEGQYKCIVFVTPSKGEGTLLLEVSAQPTTVLSPTEVEVVRGTEKSISCHMARFYPQSFKISWKAFSQAKHEHVFIAKDICTESPEKNSDGTFNVTSNLRVHPSLEENGNIFTCIVEHRTLSDPLHMDATLRVTEPAMSTEVVIWITIVTIPVCALIFGIGIFAHIRYFKKDAPKVTQITGKEFFTHMEEANLSCQITGFRPKIISFTILLQKENETEKYLYRWNGDTRTGSQNPSTFGVCTCNGDTCTGLQSPSTFGKDPEARSLLMNELEDSENVKWFKCKPQMESHKDRTFSIQCDIWIFPDVDEHDGAILCLRIEHETLPEPISQTRLLKVVGVPPKLSELVIPPKILHQESLHLTCPINGFKPKPLTITWIKKYHNDEEEELVKYDSYKNESENFSDRYSLTQHVNDYPVDATFSIFSVLTFSPTVKEDNGVRFFCKIHHHATNKKDEKMLKLLVTARPTLDSIQHIPEMPCKGEMLTLSCRIHSFFPQTLEVKWYKNDELMSEIINNSDVTVGQDGLCHCTSTIKVSPQMEDLRKTFMCSVSHESLTNHKGMMNARSQTWMLNNLISVPKQLQVVCDPDVPEQGKIATLSYTVTDYYPPECTVKWFKGFEPITATELEDPYLEVSTGLYRRKTQFTITPTEKDHYTEFSVEVCHFNRQQRTTYHMMLNGLPKVEDITLDQKVARYGQPLTLSCKVMGCPPKDVTVRWFQKEEPILNGLITKDLTCDNKPPIITQYLLKLTPTGLHFNKEFVCMVMHSNMTQAIRKQIYLQLKAQPPLLSDIKVTPAEPQVNRTVRMEIKLSNFAPNDIQVKWYKVWQECSEEVLTSEPETGENGLCFATSTFTFIPKESDSGALIRCEVTHCAAKKVVEKQCRLNFKGAFLNSKKSGESSPNLKNELQIQKKAKSSEIQCLTSNPKAGDPVTLSCFIDGCNQDDGAYISWILGMFPIDEDRIQNSYDDSGCTSTVTFVPDKKDKKFEIKCEVTSDYETVEKTYVLKLT